MPADLKVTLDAESAKLERAVERAQRSMSGLESQLRRTDLAAAELDKMLNDKRAKSLDQMGRGMIAFGAATLAGLGLATKAAIDWESAWAGVRKTVEGTPEQLAALESELRGLARTLPASHREIAAVAEAAGQLGVQRGNVAAFTRVMIMLGETTNLSADEAATAIAQLMNVMRTAPSNVGRLGAALVELGNNGASTERDIILLAQRIAGAGRIIGLSEAEVLGFASAIASVGIDAEAGGSAISRVMINIADAVASGGDAVTEFARVSGMSAQEFTTAFRDDPAQAINTFVQGLGKISDSGGNVFDVLDKLGLGEIRVRDALLRLSGAGDILTQSLDDSTRAWEENTALITEAEKRFDTTSAKISIARNALVDFAIDIGGVLLPMVASLAEAGADLAGWFSDLPGPVKAAATVLGLVAGATSLLAGSLLLLAPRLQAARDLFLGFAQSHRVAAGAMITAGQLASVAGGFFALVGAAYALGKALEENIELTVAQSTKLLLDLGEGSEEAARALIGIAAISLRDFGGSLEDLAENLEGVDSALASLVQSGATDQAEDAFRQLTEILREQGLTVEEIESVLPQYAEALATVDNQQRVTAESADPLINALAELATQFGLTGDDAAKAAQDMLDAWSGAASEFFSFTEAYDTALAAKEESERATAEATAEATGDASDSWEDFVGEVTLTVDEYLAQLERQVQAQQNWEANLLAIAGRVPPAMLSELVKMGPAGAEAVALMAQMTDAELQQAIAGWTATTGEGANAIASRLAEAAPVLASIARSHGSKVAQSIAAGMAANGTTVYAEALRQGVNIDRGVGTNRLRNVPVAVSLSGVASANATLNFLARERRIALRVQVIGGTVTGGNIPEFHGGGEVMPSGIRRHHTGWALAPDERMIIAQTGERVLTRQQNRAWSAFMQSLHQMPAQSVLGTGGGGAGAVNALVQISPWDARVPGLRDVILRATKEVIADLRVELGQSAVRGGPA